MRVQLNAVLRRSVPIASLVLASFAWTTEADAESPVVANASADTAVYADTDHVTVVTPSAQARVADRLGAWSVQGQYLVDAISAASVDIVSTASQRWSEVRQAGALEATYKPKTVGVSASGALSSEPDYLSLAGGANLSWDFFDKMHTVFAGYSYSHDTIGRSGTSFDVFSRTLNTNRISAGVTLTLNRVAVLSIVDDVVLESGNQSKPYRYIPMFDAAVAPTIGKGASIDEVNAKRLPVRPIENLPGGRGRYAVTARFGYRLARGTLRIDERLYTDTWRLHASTTEVRYYLDLSKRWTLWPRLRFNVQSAAYFWNRAYVAALGPDGRLDVPEFRTGDRELGPLETLGGGVGATFGLGRDVEPSRYSVTVQTDVMNTQFFDALYVTSRTAFLGTIGLQGAFE
jgi:hypothetical protein